MSSANNNLDLTDVASDDFEEIESKIEGFYKNDSIQKIQLSYNWERNHLMLDGKQWIIYDGDRMAGGTWKPLTVSRANEYIPRPVTNFVFDAYQTLKSYLIKSKPRSTVRPNTQTHQDKNAAKIGTLILECDWERLKEEQNYEYAAACLVAYGTVFKKDYWDMTTLTKVKVPEMYQDPLTNVELPKIDDMGQNVMQEIPLGDTATRVVEPYRMALDPLASDLHTANWLMEYSIQELQWIRDNYTRPGVAGYTNRTEEVLAEKTLNSSMRRFYQLKQSSGSSYPGTMTTATGNTDSMVDNAAIVKEYYERPNLKYPNGRLIVVANGICLYSGDALNLGDEEGDWHPYSECRWEIMPGRFWGKSPLDEIVDIQRQINAIDAAVTLTRKTMAMPQKIIPMGSGVVRGQWTGRPGQEIFCRPVDGVLPQTVQGAGVHPTVFAEREQKVNDIKQISGAIDILKGDRPPGVTAASAINMLYEVGTGKIFPTLDRWKKCVESSQKKHLKLIAKYYREPRESFIKQLKAKNKELSESEIASFLGEDLYDNCNVIVEAGSNIPKLQAAKQALLMESAAQGVLALDIPANRIEYQRQLGIVGFDNDVGPDVKRQEWENELLDNVLIDPQGAQKAVVLEVDNDAIHLEVLERRMKQPNYMELDPQVWQAYMKHREQHKTQQMQKNQQQMMEAMMTGQPPMPPGAPQGHMPAPHAGNGMGMHAKDAILNADMPPGMAP